MTDFERGRQRGISQAIAMVDHHFGGPPTPPMTRGIINEMRGLAHVPTPETQTEAQSAEQDRML